MMRRLTSVIGWLRRVNPLLPLNGHLLKSWPSVWRSRVIHVLWWSAVTLVGLYAIGMLIPVGIEDIPTVGTLNMHAILIWQLIAVAMGYWVILTWRTPLPSRRPAAPWLPPRPARRSPCPADGGQ